MDGEGHSFVVSEADVIAQTDGQPLTRPRLVADLLSLGVRPGMTLMVHSSLSSLGWVVGGATSVIHALEEAVGPAGTIVMPGFSNGAPEPSRWRHPPVPEAWWGTIRREWPPFDPDTTPTRGLGAIAEEFRQQPGTYRSRHPNLSFCARGPHARELTAAHHLDYGLGERSPLDRLYDLDGKILLLGVDHGSNTTLHLAEFRSRWKGREEEVRYTGRVLRDGKVAHVRFVELDWNDDDFAQLGLEYEKASGDVKVGTVGLAESRLMDVRPLVDFAVDWLVKHRGPMEGKPARSADDSGSMTPPKYQYKQSDMARSPLEGRWQSAKRRERAGRTRR